MLRLNKYNEDRVQNNLENNSKEYNPFKRNLSSIPSFDQLLPAGNMDTLMIKNTNLVSEPIDESDLELQYELEKSVGANSRQISSNSTPYNKVTVRFAEFKTHYQFHVGSYKI